MTDGKLQWHPAFSAVFRIELAPELKRMQMEAEHLLAKKPLQIDILVVKKKKEEKKYKKYRTNIQDAQYYRVQVTG